MRSSPSWILLLGVGACSVGPGEALEPPGPSDARDAGAVGVDAGCGAYDFTTDESAWRARVPQAIEEAFAREELRDAELLPLPYQTRGGLELASIGEAPMVQFVATDAPHIHFRDFGSGLRVTLPRRASFVALRFITRDPSWRLDVDDRRFDLGAAGAGFVVYEGECAGVDGFVLSNAGDDVQRGLSVYGVAWW